MGRFVLQHSPTDFCNKIGAFSRSTNVHFRAGWSSNPRDVPDEQYRERNRRLRTFCYLHAGSDCFRRERCHRAGLSSTPCPVVDLDHVHADHPFQSFPASMACRKDADTNGQRGRFWVLTHMWNGPDGKAFFTKHAPKRTVQSYVRPLSSVI